MAVYRSYDAVKKAQAFLQAGKDAGAYDFPGSLKLAGDTYSGEWDDATMEAFWSWLMTQPEGSDLQTLVVQGVITAAEKATIDQAMHEYTVVKEGGTLPPDANGKRPIWKYVVGGLIVLGVSGLVIWAISRQRDPRELPAHAGMGWR